MKKLKNTVISCFVCVILIFCPLLNTFAASYPSFSVTQTDISGSKVTLTVSVDTTVYNVSGLMFYLKYDTDKVAFENKSIKILQSSIKAEDVNKGNAKNGKIYFTYVGSVSSPVAIKKGNIASFEFTVLSAEAEQIPIELCIEDFYNKKLKQIEVSSKTVQGFIQSDGNAAAKVINLINQIGNVTYPDSNAKILAARKAYNQLSAAEKQAVSNADVLNEAEAVYNRLRIEALNADAKAKAQEFKEKHSEILSKKPAYEGDGALTLSDEALITAAQDDYNSYPASVKAMLNKEINYLYKLKKYFSILESIEQAKDTLKAFNENFAYYLETDINSITSSDLTGLGQAKQMLDNMASTFEDIGEWVEKNTGRIREIINKMYEKALFLSEYENADSTKEYLSFMDEYGKWLTAAENDITKDDQLSLGLAKQAYELMSKEAQALAGEKFYKHIVALFEKASSLDWASEPDGGSDVVIDGGTDTVIKTVTKNIYLNSDKAKDGDGSQSNKVLLNFIRSKKSNAVLILLVSLGSLMIILALAVVSQVILCKKYNIPFRLFPVKEVRKV